LGESDDGNAWPTMMTVHNEPSPLALYREMQLIRTCEERLAKSHQRGLIHGACHTYVGQEAVAVGVCAHLRRETRSSARIADMGMRWRRGSIPGRSSRSCTGARRAARADAAGACICSRRRLG
jgi:TPP-dependent pyruvate/acetoin dehydrogenase alpha subunit